MTRTKLFCLVFCLFLLFAGWTTWNPLFAVEQSADSATTEKIRVLFFFGGHSFDEPEMYQMLDSFKDVVYDKAEMPNALNLLKPGLDEKYDVLVMYDSYKFPYTKEQTDLFQQLVENGIGLVVLHHSVAGYEGWDEFVRMIGGHFILARRLEIEGKRYSASTWDHDQTVEAEVVDREHPVMKGIDDFTIVDETYGGVYVSPDSHILLKTEHPKSTRELAWTTKYGKSVVLTTLLGHDKEAYFNPNFAKMVHQGIQWTAAETRKLKTGK